MSAPVSKLASAPYASGLALTLVLGLSACASQKVTKSELDQVRDLIRYGQFVEAVNQASQLAQDRPRDPEAEQLHRDASVAYLVARGREKTFEGRDESAMEDFQSALALDPGSRTAKDWELKTARKLANIWFERARGFHTADNLEGARQAYETSLQHYPQHQGSIEGLARVGIQQNYRAGLSHTYYNEGVRAVSDWRLEEAKHRFQGSAKYGGESGRVTRRISDVNRELAAQRIQVAQQLEKDGLFAAARNDYRTASLMDPDSEAAKEGLERAKREAGVTRMLEDAQMAVLRGEFEAGRKLMLQAREITEAQDERVDKALAGIDEERASQAYQAALDLEHDFQYEQAIAAYQKVIDDHGYDLAQDSQARINTLSDYVRDAEELYAEASDAESADARRDLLRQIEVFWPEYLDIQEQLDALR